MSKAGKPMSFQQTGMRWTTATTRPASVRLSSEPVGPSFVEQVGALRSFFGVPPDMPLKESVAFMNQQMGMDETDGPLPEQVASLLVATGLVVPQDGGSSSPRRLAWSSGRNARPSTRSRR